MGGSHWKETIPWEVYGLLFDKLLPEVVNALDAGRPWAEQRSQSVW